MSGLLRFAAGLRRPLLGSRARLQSLPLLSARPVRPQSLQSREISTTNALLKRLGGNSAFAKASSGWSSGKGSKKRGALSTKQKLKRDTAPHRTHLESARDLKAKGRDNLRNARQWAALERDEELTRDLDEAFEYLDNLGPQGNYIYQPEPTLADVDERDALEKLNAIARGDPDVLKQVEQTQALAREETEEEGDTEAEAEATDSSPTLAVEDYNFLLRVYAIKGLHKEANALLARMEANLEPATAGVKVSPVDKTAESTDLALLDTLESVPHVVAPNAQSYMLYASALAKSKQAAPAVRVLGRMKERGVKPDTPMYNAVMNACAKAGRVPWAYNVMEKMQVAGLVPDRASFTILMNAAIAENDLDKAFETFQLMRTHVTEPDVVTFNCLINGYAREGRVEKALNLLEDLLECGLTPSLTTFNSLMNACAKSHYYAHKAVDFYYEMQELYDYIPDQQSYATVLHACAKHGDFIQAEQIMRHVERHAVPVNEIMYNTLLNVYARAQVKSIVDKAPRNQKPRAPPQPIYQDPLEWDDDGKEVDLNRPGKETFSLANANYDGRFGDDDEDEDEDEEEVEGEELSAEAEQQLAELRAQDKAQHEAALAGQDAALAPTERSMEVYGEEDARLFADSEESLDFELTPMDLQDFGKFQTLNIKRAEIRFHEMTVEKNMTPSVITLNTMLNVYANALRLRSAEVFLAETFDKFGQKPDKYTYRALMHMYVRAKRTPSAEQLLDRVRSEVANDDVEADEVTFGLLVDHYARKRLLRRALSLLEEADALGLQLQEKHLKQVRKLSERFGVFSDLIPEDPNAVILAGSRHKLMEKRKVRQQVLDYNRKVGKRYLLPETASARS